MTFKTAGDIRMNRYYHYFRISGLSVILSMFGFLSSLSSNVLADENELYKSRINKEWQKASNAELDSIRGGFTLPNGIVIDFSFEKVIYRNGVEIFSSIFELPTNIPLIKNGDLNIAKDITNAMINSVIQNNLDNQVIRTVNTVNIDISHLKNINFNISNIETFRNIILPTIIK